jgi:hypothetical protein
MHLSTRIGQARLVTPFTTNAGTAHNQRALGKNAAFGPARGCGFDHGKKRITLGMANLLASNLGATAEFWMKRDYVYCEEQGILDQYRGQKPKAEQKSFWWEDK